jgi:hypothetical protein
VSFVALAAFAAIDDGKWSTFVLFGAFVSSFFECVRAVIHSRGAD